MSDGDEIADGPPRVRRRPFIRLCLEVFVTDMKLDFRGVILRTAAFLVAVALVILLPRLWTGNAAAKPAVSTDPARVPIWPGALPLDYQAHCGGNQVAAMTYWPQPGDTIYRADFMAQGGGDVYLSLPLGYESGVTLPDDGNWYHETITVTVPFPVGTGPIRPIYIMADVYCAPPLAGSSPYFRPARGGPLVNAPAHLTDLNVYAVSSGLH